jgi:hypothetical protein
MAEEIKPMVRRLCGVARRIFRALVANPEMLAGGSAMSEPLGLLAVERQRAASRRAQQDAALPGRPRPCPPGASDSSGRCATT